MRIQDPWYRRVISERSALVGILLVMALGAFLRLWGLQFGLPHPFARPDEEVVVDLALGVLKDPNPHFFDWPTLFAYMTAAVYAALFAIERSIGGAITDATVAKALFEPALHLVPRVLSAAAGIATIAALFGAAKELFSTRVALLASAFLAVTFLHVRDSHFGVTDVPATFLAVCAFWEIARCATKGVTLRRAAVAGVLCGLATSTKYNTALMLLPAIVAIVWQPERPARPRRVIRALVVLLLGAAIAFVAGTPYAVLDSSTFLAAVTGVGRHLQAGHVVMARGWMYHAIFTLRYGLGIPLLAGAGLGGLWLIARQPRAAALVLAFPVPYYIVLGSGLTVFVRYMVPIVPFACLAAAVFVDRFADALVNWLKQSHAAVRHTATAALAAVIAIPTATSSVLFDRLMTKSDTRVLGAEWVVSKFPKGATIYQNGYGYVQLRPTPLVLYPEYGYNDRTNRFEREGRPTTSPDVIVLHDSPLGVYTLVPAPIAALVEADYVLVATFTAITPSGAQQAVYDLDDAFFAPFGGIENALRPGSNIRVFERREAR
jgi:4-amino-4-deoxy-L-arabinose transferase-like glycosyltransferase